MLLSQKQTEFVQCANHRWNFKGGATRSGKTYLDFKWIIPTRIRERIGKNGLVVLLGVTKSTIERNVLEPMRKIYGSALVGEINSQNKVRLFGEMCYALGAEKVSQVSKIRGTSIKYCYGDEVADWSEEVFTLLKSRLDQEYSCFDGTFNPKYPTHWLKKFLDSDADLFSQTYSIDDNPFISKTVVDELKKEYAGTVFYERYILGLWVAAEGIIYKDFSSSISAGASNKYLWPADKELIPWRVHIGVDFGGNKSKHAFVAAGVLPGYKGVVILQSQRPEPDTPERLNKELIEFCGSVFARWHHIDSIYCDNESTVLMRGIRVHARQSKYPWLADRVHGALKIKILDRIELTSSLMGSGRLWYLPEAETVRDALASALWSGKHPGKDERLDDGTTDIDSLDAFEYTIERDYKRYLHLGVS